MSEDYAPCEAVASAARYVQREWGDEGYGVAYCGERASGSDGAVYVFRVICHRDGSRFAVLADRYGNVDYVRDGETVRDAVQSWEAERRERFDRIDREMAR